MCPRSIGRETRQASCPPITPRRARSYAPVMSDRTTPWFPTNMHPARSGWYQLDSADLLHFDTHSKTWGIWFPPHPEVRHVIDVAASALAGTISASMNCLLCTDKLFVCETCDAPWPVPKMPMRPGSCARTATRRAQCLLVTHRWHTRRNASAISQKNGPEGPLPVFLSLSR